MMKPARSFFLVAAAFALFISACSQPEDLQAPSLKPQFGTADRDAESSVTLAPGGGSYVLSEQSGGYSDSIWYYNKVILRRYSSSGNLVWVKAVAELEVDYDTYDYPYLVTGSIERDASGKAYVLSGRGEVFEDNGTITYHDVYVYSPSGTLQRSFEVGESGYTYDNGTDGEAYPHMVVDANGNTYIGIAQAIPDRLNYAISIVNLLRKYSPTGTLLWERTLNIGIPNGVAVAENGNVYVAGRSGLARYSSAGKLLWKKPGFYTGVATSGSSIYTHNKNKVFAFNSAGQTRWTRVIGGLNEAHIQDLGGDGNGNVFVSGKYLAGSGNRNAFARKLHVSGTSQ